MYDKFERNKLVLVIQETKTPLVIEAHTKIPGNKKRVESLRVNNTLKNKYNIPLTQREMSELGNYSFDTYNKAKNTETGFNLQILVAFAVIFDVSLDWLILGEETDFSIHDKIEKVESVHHLENLVESQKKTIAIQEKLIATQEQTITDLMKKLGNQK